MAVSFILDTNIVLYLLRGDLLEDLPKGKYFISVITEMELLSYGGLEEPEKNALLRLLGQISLVGLTPAVRRNAIEIRPRHKLKLPDAIIAASAIALSVPLITNDKRLLAVNEVASRSIKIRLL